MRDLKIIIMMRIWKETEISIYTLTIIYLNFLICKMEIIIVPTSQAFSESMHVNSAKHHYHHGISWKIWAYYPGYRKFYTGSENVSSEDSCTSNIESNPY